MFEMNYPTVHYREPWQDMPVEEKAPYTCDICGEEFYPGEFGHKAFTDSGLQKTFCEDCYCDFIKSEAFIHAREFIRSDDEIQREFAEWWFEGLDPVSKTEYIKEMYMSHERHQRTIEAEFANNHRYWQGWIEKETEAENL